MAVATAWVMLACWRREVRNSPTNTVSSSIMMGANTAALQEVLWMQGQTWAQGSAGQHSKGLQGRSSLPASSPQRPTAHACSQHSLQLPQGGLGAGLGLGMGCGEGTCCYAQLHQQHTHHPQPHQAGMVSTSELSGYAMRASEQGAKGRAGVRRER